MIVAVADTHAVLWYLGNRRLLSSIAADFIDRAGEDENQIGVSAITLAECVYLVEKGRISPLAWTQLRLLLEMRTSVFAEIALTSDVASVIYRVDPAKIPDMPDRIISATALWLTVPVITADSKIQASGLRFIW